jgi:Icc protein
MRPLVLVQLSDCHVGADWGDGDAVLRLAAAVDAVGALQTSPAAVLLSGDVVDHGAAAEYEQARDLLAPLAAPLHVLPGNHDDRAELRRCFGLPGAGDEPVQYAVDLGPLRLVVADTQRPGDERGELDAARLSWLDSTLAEAPDMPTLLALHHPPITTGVPAFDEVGLPAPDRHAFAEIVAAHPQVLRILAGHLHCAVAGDVAGRTVLAAPSTYVQARLDPGTEEIVLSDEPRGFAVHVLVEREVVSHVESVERA